MILVGMLLRSLFPEQNLQQEAPVCVAEADAASNQPDPDFALLNRTGLSLTRDPLPSEIQLLVEVSDTTLAFDLRVKARLYARAGIPEYCVLDVNEQRVFVHREPADGEYRMIAMHPASSSIAPIGRPDCPVSALALFQPR